MLTYFLPFVIILWPFFLRVFDKYLNEISLFTVIAVDDEYIAQQRELARLRGGTLPPPQEVNLT